MSYTILFDLVDKFRTQDFRLMSKYLENPTKFSSNSQKLDPVIDLCKELYPSLSIREALHLAKNHLDTQPKCPSCGGHLPFKTEPTLHYPMYCSNACKLEVQGAGGSIAVRIDGVVYKSISAASKCLGIDFTTVKHRILSSKYQEYSYVDNHEENCRGVIETIHPDFLNKDVLTNWVKSGRPIKELAKKYGIKSYPTIKAAFVYHDIEY